MLVTPSLYDYDALVVDSRWIWPVELDCQPGSTSSAGLFASLETYRRQFSVKKQEGTHLLARGGLIVCLLQPLAVLTGLELRKGNLESSSMNQYDWIPVPGMGQFVREATGQQMRRTKSSPFDDYLKLDQLTWVAFLDNIKDAPGIEILAKNNADLAVACRFISGPGSIYVLPYSAHPQANKVILECLSKSIGGQAKRKAPDWLPGWVVPGEKNLLDQIQDTRQQRISLQEREQTVGNELYEVSLIKNLLYEQGTPLEDAVKAAFKELGFTLEKENDKDLVAKDQGEKVIFEVTGSQGAIDVGKFRQLLDYLMTDKHEGRSPKSILIGNHQIDIEPGKRGDPFTERAVTQSKVYGTCLLPSVELYHAVVQVRQDKLNPSRFWETLLNTSGVFKLETLDTIRTD